MNGCEKGAGGGGGVGLEGASASEAIPELGSFRKIVSEGGDWLASLAGPGAGGRGSGAGSDWR